MLEKTCAIDIVPFYVVISYIDMFLSIFKFLKFEDFFWSILRCSKFEDWLEYIYTTWSGNQIRMCWDPETTSMPFERGERKKSLFAKEFFLIVRKLAFSSSPLAIQA